MVLNPLSDQVLLFLHSNHKHHRRWNFLLTGRLFGLTLLIVLLASCAPQTRNTSLPLETAQAFSDSGLHNAPDKGWRAFEDPQLNQLVDSGLSANFNLKTAWQRLRAAQAVVDRESSSLFPDLETSLNGQLNGPASRVSQTENLRLGLSSVYEIDLWGRIRSQVEAERYRAKASMMDYQTAALSLSAEMVRTWYQLAEARKQLSIVEQQVETDERVLELIRARFGNGQIRSVDIIRQRRLLEATREQKMAAETRIQVLEHQLAVLSGRQPQLKTESSLDSLPKLPPIPETGIPIELVKRRPDIQSAYNRLRSADRELASAISSRYPRLTLSASLSSSAGNINDLFENWAYSVAGNLLAPVFYGGRLNAEVRRMEAVKKQRLYEYGQTVLTAFREVEDALIQEKKQKERIGSIEKQLALARQSYQQLRIEYFNGMGNYLDVLTALDEQQQLRRDLSSARLRLLEYRIALYRALSGGFEIQKEVADNGR